MGGEGAVCAAAPDWQAALLVYWIARQQSQPTAAIKYSAVAEWGQQIRSQCLLLGK